MGPKVGAAPKVAAAPGKEIIYEGMPPGWKAIEKPYLTGAYKGQTYVRFFSDKHKNVGSLKKAIALHAEDTGQDPEEAIRIYERIKEEAAEAKKAEREQKGFLEGQKRDEAVATFREKYGKLDGATICELPGWKGESKLLPQSQQICARYYSPDGQTYALVINIEALFGLRMQNGEPIPDIEAARARVKVDENGKPVNVARQENVLEDFTLTKGGENPEVASKRLKRRHSETEQRLAKPEDYRESEHLRVLKLLAEGSAAALESNGVPEAESVGRKAVEIHEQLVSRGFPPETELLFVTGSKNTRTPGRRLLDSLSGVYHLRPELYNARPYYQKVDFDDDAADASPALACSGHYISWSEAQSVWRIGALDDNMAGFAVCREDLLNPVALAESWCLYEPNVEGAELDNDQENKASQEPAGQPAAEGAGDEPMGAASAAAGGGQ